MKNLSLVFRSLALPVLLLTLNAAGAQEKQPLRYVDAATLTVIGKSMPTPKLFQRVDTARYELWQPVKNYSAFSTGLAVVFRTDSRTIRARWKTGGYGLGHNMTAIARKGLDLYIERDGQWVYAYYRKHGKLDGCALLSPDQIEKLKASMASSWRSDPRPFESYQLTNNNAEIRRVKARIEQLSKQAQQEFSGWEFDGGRVEMNREDNRLQVFFDGKPDADTRAELKSSGFRWAPSVGAWQRQLTDNAIRAADRLECIKPLSGEKPSQLQKKPSILQTMREQGEKVQTEPEKKAPSGRDAER